MFQAFNLVPSLTAAQNVALPLRLDGERPGKAEVASALALVGLGDRAAHLPSELSGGQQQRVAIARALISRPSVLFADEPTGALDITSSRTVLQQLRRLVDQHRQTVVTVTHDRWSLPRPTGCCSLQTARSWTSSGRDRLRSALQPA